MLRSLIFNIRGYSIINNIKKEIKNISYDEYNNLKNQNKLILLKFYTNKCTHCHTSTPLIEKVYAEREDIVIYNVNAVSEKELVEEFDINTVPQIISMFNGVYVTSLNGKITEQNIIEFIKKSKDYVKKLTY